VARSFDDAAVDGNLLAGPNPQSIAYLHIRAVISTGTARLDLVRRLRRQPQERTNRARRLSAL